MTRSRQTADWGSRAGLAKIVPSSVAVGSGTGSANTLGTVTFSGCSSVSLNNCFSSNYENYRIIMQISSTASIQILVRLRANGTDNTTASSYAWNTSAQQGDGLHTQTNADDKWSLTYFSQASDRFAIADIARPYLAVNTELLSSSNQSNALMLSSGTKADTNVYDGFTVYASSGTISGAISVYGYTK